MRFVGRTVNLTTKAIALLAIGMVICMVCISRRTPQISIDNLVEFGAREKLIMSMGRCVADPPTRFNTDVVIQWANITEIEPSNIVLSDGFTAKDTFVELKYELRSFFKHGMLGGSSPSVRDVHVVHADGHPPRNLRKGRVADGGHNLKFQPHSAMWRDTSNLPTANRNAIANTVHRIPGLADWFVFCEDDMFLVNDFTMDYFYDYAQSRVRARLSRYPVENSRPNGYDGAMFHSGELLREIFGERKRHAEAHTCVLANRCVLEEAERQWPAEYAITEANRLQQKEDLQFQAWSQNMLIDAEVGDKTPDSQSGTLQFHGNGDHKCDSLTGPGSLGMLEYTRSFLNGEAKTTEKQFIQLQGPGISDEYAADAAFAVCRCGDIKRAVLDWYEEMWPNKSTFEL